ncbi:MAG: fatty acid desaturase CarF family protein [Candidatus Rokuibacteriota bacterium]
MRGGLALLEGSAVAACALLAVPIIRRLALPLEPVGLLAVLLAVVAGYLLADLLSGLVHWFCDRFFEEHTPVIGAVLIFPFREHHRDPLAMTRHGFLELTGNSCLGLAPVLALAWWWPLSVWLDALVLVVAAGVVATNLLHKWAHAATAPAPVRWLQRWRLVLPPDAHAVHHRPGHAGAYCVTAGWMNTFTDRLRLFDGLGHALAAVGVPRTTAGD